jgi:Mg2+ and Co2+ transporter CorA
VHRDLAFHKQLLGNLRFRSTSNQTRLQNEIQLAFNTVAQYDSGVSINISQTANINSAAIRMISLLTLAFVLPTFTCAIFSMSFFNYSPESGWTISGKVWIYLASALPLTLGASAICYFWDKVFPAK